MSRIIPAILTNDLEELKRLSRLLAPYAALLHFDMADGSFVPETTIHDPVIFKELHFEIPFEAHLLMHNSERIVHNWVIAGAHRIIIHAESRGNLGLTIEQVKKYDRQIGLSINPETKPEDCADWFGLVDFVHLMSVNPGGQGRSFHASVFDKIAWFKHNHPRLRLSIDGGVNESNIVQLAKAGVEDLVVGSAIVKQKNPLAALKKLNKLIIK